MKKIEKKKPHRDEERKCYLQNLEGTQLAWEVVVQSFII